MQYNGSTYFDKVFPLKFIACEVLSFPLTRSNTNGSHGDAHKVLQVSKERGLTSTPSSFLLTDGSVGNVIKLMPSVYPALEHNFEQPFRSTIL
jgi:hypothetical protein